MCLLVTAWPIQEYITLTENTCMDILQVRNDWTYECPAESSRRQRPASQLFAERRKGMSAPVEREALNQRVSQQPASF